MKEKLKRGDYVEIIKDINCIPAGIYQLKDKLEDFYIFSPGGNINFGVSKSGKNYLRKLKKRSPNCTSKREFTFKYKALFEELKKAPSPGFDPLQPITCCFFDPNEFDEVPDDKSGSIH